MSRCEMRVAEPEAIELTLTITLPVHAWRRVSEGKNWNPFNDAVREAIRELDALSIDRTIEA